MNIGLIIIIFLEESKEPIMQTSNINCINHFYIKWSSVVWSVHVLVHACRKFLNPRLLKL